MRKETEEKYKKICELRKAGKSRKEIVEELCCSTSTIDVAIRAFGEKERRDGFENHEKDILSMWRDGEKLGRIAEKTGLSVTTINRHLLSMGMKRGSGWKPALEKQAPRGAMVHREQAEQIEEPEVSPRQYADNTRRSKTVVIRGKTYQDVSAWYM